MYYILTGLSLSSNALYFIRFSLSLFVGLSLLSYCIFDFAVIQIPPRSGNNRNHRGRRGLVSALENTSAKRWNIVISKHAPDIKKLDKNA